MNAILESPSLRNRAFAISVDTYHRMVDQDMVPCRAELLRGVIVMKMSKTPLHVILSNRIYSLFQAGVPDGFWLRKEEPLTLRDSEPEPDLSIVAGLDVDFLLGHPSSAHLVVEVSVTTESQDREMLTIYAEANVSECWIVLARKQKIEIHSQPVQGSYLSCEILNLQDTAVSTAFPSVRIELSKLFPER